ncbi:MAG: hypothetical protein IT374_11675 [Polyangiaceae bacterium]|nr:hypothetical protein [Polyangiaceae bacterium]
MSPTRALVVVPLLLLGCDDAPKSSAKPAPSADKGPVVDAKVAAAVAAAASAKKLDPKKNDGPPPGGVFAPGAADALFGPKDGVKVELGAPGDAAKVTLKAPSADAWKGAPTVFVSVRLGQRSALPSLDLSLGLSVEKPKEEGAAAAWLAEVKKVSLSKEQMGAVPKEAEKELGKLKGSVVAFSPSTVGASRPELRAEKDATGQLSLPLDGLAASLFYGAVPPPPAPVGKGGFWIAGSRQRLNGFDVVTYRMYKVKEIDGDKVTLTLEGHSYAASGETTLPGIQKGTQLAQFESTAQGELVVRAGAALAESADLQSVMTAVFGQEGQPGRALQVATISSWGKPAAKK